MARNPNIECDRCGNTYYKRPGAMKKKNYCLACYCEMRKRPKRICPICKTEFEPATKRRIYCSRSCAGRVKHGNPIDIRAYLQVAIDRGFVWAGSAIPRTTKDKTAWLCSCGSIWKTNYDNIMQNGTVSCPDCQLIRAKLAQRLDWRINGHLFSSQQKHIAEMLAGKINHKIGNSICDVVLQMEKVVVEYDSWFWHGHKSQEDYERAMELIDQGWRVISVKANTELPTPEQIKECIDLNVPYVELVLNDWGNGPIAQGVW